jgi:hypothetical protein
VFGGFPWNISLINGKSATINNIEFGYVGTSCGPQAIDVAISKKGHWSVSGGTGNCAILGDATSIPSITIAHD